MRLSTLIILSAMFLVLVAGCDRRKPNSDALSPVPNVDPTQLAAGKVADAFMTGAAIIEEPEARQALESICWPQEVRDFSMMPHITGWRTLHETLFTTQKKDYRGYRRLMQVSIVSAGPEIDNPDDRSVAPAGTVVAEKYAIVAYADPRSNQWKIFAFRKAQDVEARITDLQVRLARSDDFRKAYQHWLLIALVEAGRFDEAWTALEAAKSMPNDKDPRERIWHLLPRSEYKRHLDHERELEVTRSGWRKDAEEFLSVVSPREFLEST